MLILTGLALILALTAATGWFVAQEFAYVAVDRGRLRALADDGDAAAQRALRVTGRLSFVLSGAQVGITVTALLAGYVAEPFLGEGLAPLLGAAGLPAAVSLSVSVALALLLATVIQMVLGELAPKNLAIARPVPLARALARSTLLYLTVAGPVIRVFDSVSNRLLRRVGIEPVEELPQGATPEDLDRIIAASRDRGLLDEDTSRLLDHGLDFARRTAGEVMVPRVDVVTVAADAPAAAVVALLDTGHSRFPVTGRSVDDLVGVISVADLANLPAATRPDVPARAVAAPPLLVPASLPLPAALDLLRTERRQLACVVDEYGGFAGVLSLEDIAEELVGEIRDEDDHPSPAARELGERAWSVPARWRPDEVADATGIALPGHDSYDTVGGLVLHALGRLPAVGDEVVLPPGVGQPAVTLRVEAVQRHVPVRVAVRAGEPS
ncbi:membrane protein [Pilimelia anulata]|uniref:Membrane protein n=1 Tax=Pilimelia anulata TaxID=53371 RepID=A0A8J3FAE6_9ACTN|nr:hemolysin family protein [Pilimelia anulata]GGJ96939.1 membrane protein [Pilimelia anulata]